MIRGLTLSVLWIGLLCSYAYGDATPLVVMDFIPARQSLNPEDPVALRRHYDEVLLTTALQGLLNRDRPILFVRYNAQPDDFWFAKMTEPGGWQAGRPVVRVNAVADLLRLFPDTARGLVVWDERVPATSHVATTVAGVEDLLPVRFDGREGSLYRELTSGTLPLPIVRRLLREDGSPLFTGSGQVPQTGRASSGSAKNDAYLWLLENYIEAGRTRPDMLGYFIDAFWLQCRRVSALQNHMLNNLDVLVANRATVFDLNVWPDEATVDDPNQPHGTDLKTLREILAASVERTGPERMIAVFGFPPWAFKYTNHRSRHWNAGGRHGPVPTEWRFVELISAYNAYKDADALGYSSFPNASFYQHYEVPAVVEQDAEPTREKLIRDGVLDEDGNLLAVNYYAHYQGDFDAAAWVYWHFPKIWHDPARGTLPQSWGINPSIAVRFPFGLHTIRKESAAGEVFVAAQGAGYVHVSLLQAPRPEPGLPDALDLWARHNERWYRQWDLRVTAFNIDGNTRPFDDCAFAAYRRFSPGGIGLQFAPAAFGVREGVPFVRKSSTLPGSEGNADMGQTVEAVSSFFREETPNFLLFRSILQSPSYYAQIRRRLQEPGHLPNKLVDVPTLMWLVREYQTNPAYRTERPSYAQARQVHGSPGLAEGVRRHAASDGMSTVVDVEGERAWRIDGSGRAFYCYFGVDESFARSLNGQGVTVRVTYLDERPGRIGLHYDSRDETAPVHGAYKPAGDATMTGSGQWRIAEFILPDPLFTARQNGSADFRLHAFGHPLTIRAVLLERRGEGTEDRGRWTEDGRW